MIIATPGIGNIRIYMLYDKGKRELDKKKRQKKIKETQGRQQPKRKKAICKKSLVMHPKSTFIPGISTSHCVTIRREWSSLRHHIMLYPGEALGKAASFPTPS